MHRVLSLVVTLLLMAVSVPALSAVYDIPVTASGDVVNYRDWGYGGAYRWSDASANPNTVSHSYDPGYGFCAETSLTFDLSSFAIPASEISSASFNFNILDVWTSGRNDVANFSGTGTVYADGGTGWHSFDVTDSFKSAVLASSTSLTYSFSYTGYSGFNFGSAEGGQPAFLHITTAGVNSVPDPSAALLLYPGLFGLWAMKRRLRK